MAPTIRPEAIREIRDLLEPLALRSGLVFEVRETAPFTLELKMFAREPSPENENLLKQLALIDGMDAYREQLSKTDPYPSWREIHAKEDEFWEAIEALQPDEGLVGQLIKFGVGDGYANYLITAEAGRKVEVCWIGTGDCWSWNGVDEHSMIDRAVAERQVGLAGGPKLPPMFGNSRKVKQP